MVGSVCYGMVVRPEFRLNGISIVKSCEGALRLAVVMLVLAIRQNGVLLKTDIGSRYEYGSQQRSTKLLF